ncbi:hypothetical protein [Streptomyces lydicus]
MGTTYARAKWVAMWGFVEVSGDGAVASDAHDDVEGCEAAAERAVEGAS